MLVDSFLELGLDAEAMIASKPKQIVKIVAKVLAATTTTTTTTTPRLSSTTTTPAPNRRRIAAGWPASGAEPCEDNNPSDAADTDCYADRYASFKDDIYKKLQTMSEAVQTTATYADKLGTFIASVKIPAFQESLAFTINDSIPILQQSLNDGFNDVNTAIQKSKADTTALAIALDTKANATELALRAKVQDAFNSFTATNLGNINALIKRANDINSKNAATGYAKELQYVNGNGTVRVTNDEASMQSLINKLSLLHNTVSTNVFYSESNLTSIKLPQVLSQDMAWVTSKQNALNSTLDSLIKTTITLNNISSVVAQTDSGIASTLSAASTDTNKAVSDKSTRAMAAVNNLASQINQASSTISSNYNKLTTSVKAAESTVRNNSFLTYVNQIAAVQQLLGNLSTYGTEYISAWETGANAKLTRMKGLVAGYASALAANASGTTANGTDSIQSSVLASLAAAGNVQNQINAEMIARQAAALAAMQELMSKSSGDSAQFSKLLANISTAMTALQTAARAGEPLDIFSQVVGALEKLAMNISNVAQDVNGTLDVIKRNTSARLETYSNTLAEYWESKLTTGFGADLQKKIDDAVSVEELRFKNVSDTLNGLTSMLEGTTSSALANVQIAANGLYESNQKTQSVIVNALNLVSLKAAEGIQNLTRALDSYKSNMGSLSVTLGGDADSATALNTFKISQIVGGNRRNDLDLDNSVRKVGSQVQQGVDSLVRNIQSSVAQPAAYLLSLMQGATSGSLQASTALKATINEKEKLLNDSLTDLNIAMNQLVVSDVRTTINNGLDQLYVSKNQIFTEVQAVHDRISAGLSTVESANSTLTSIMANLAALSTTGSASTVGAVNMLIALINAGLNINAILEDEIATLSQEVVEAATGFNQTLADLQSLVDAKNIIDVWYTESNATVASNWAIQQYGNEKQVLDDAYQAGLEDIRLNANTTRPALNASMKAAVDLYRTNITSLGNALNQSAANASSVSALFMASMTQTVNQLMSQLKSSDVSGGDAQLEQLQLVLNSVSGSVGAATGAASNNLLASGSGILGGILDSSDAAVSNVELMQTSASKALQNAVSAVNSGVSSVNSFDRLVAASEAERANSAATVLNQINKGQAAMSQMMHTAMSSAIQSSTATMPVDKSLTSVPQLLQAISGQLAAWASYASDQTARLAEFQKESSAALESEKSMMSKGFSEAGNEIVAGATSIKSTIGSILFLQKNLGEELVRLSAAEDRINSALPVSGETPASVQDVSTGGIASLAMTGNQLAGLLSAEANRMTGIEENVEALIEAASQNR